MDQNEFERKKLAATYIVEVAEEYLDKIKSNSEAIVEKRISSKSVAQIAGEITKLLGKLVHELKASDADPQDKIQKTTEFLSSLISSLELTAKSSAEEIIRMEATQEGMRRALEAVKGAGVLKIKELEKIENLSYESLDDERRHPGERPEKISVKRNASALRKSRESEDS